MFGGTLTVFAPSLSPIQERRAGNGQRASKFFTTWQNSGLEEKMGKTIIYSALHGMIPYLERSLIPGPKKIAEMRVFA